MVLIYENDPLDNEHARGRFYHVCRGQVEQTELSIPPAGQAHECPRCGIDLEAEDFFVAMQKGSV